MTCTGIFPIHRFVPRLCGECFLIAFICAFAVSGFAADWSFTPSATLSEAYDSNFRFTSTTLPGESKSDFITSFTPVLSITGETEQTRFTFDTITSAQAYVDNPRYDIVNTNTTAGLTEAWSPRFSTMATVGFLHDSTLEEQLAASGIVSQKTEHYQFNSGLSCTYGLSENLNLIASGSWARSTYPSGTLADSDVYQGSITPVWAINERNNIGLSSSFSYTSYSGSVALGGGNTMKTVNEMLFFERSFSETMSLKVGGGYYFSSLDFERLTPEIVYFPPFPFPFLVYAYRPVSATDGGFIFSADLRKDWSERLSTTFSAGRQQYNDVNARSFNSMFLGCTATYRLSELSTFNLTARYNTNNQLSQGLSQGTQNIDYYIVSPSIERNLSENLVLRLAGSYEYESKNYGSIAASKSNIDRFRTWVDLSYKWPRFLASH